MHDGWLIDTRPPRGDLFRAGRWAFAAVLFGGVFVVAGLLPNYEASPIARALVVAVGMLTVVGGIPSMRRLKRGLRPSTLALSPNGVEYDGPRGESLRVSWPQVCAAELRTAQLVFVVKGKRSYGALLTALELHLRPDSEHGAGDALRRADGVYQVRIGGRPESSAQAHQALLRYVADRYRGCNHVGEIRESGEHRPF